MPRTEDTLAQRIRSIRRATKLTQQEFGERIGGLSKSAVSKYEAGDAAPPLEVLSKISALGNRSLGWLVSGEEAATRPETGGADEGHEADRGYGKDLPEPVRKAIEVLEKNPDRAWELYALILERVEKK